MYKKANEFSSNIVFSGFLLLPKHLQIFLNNLPLYKKYVLYLTSRLNKLKL